MSDEIKAVHRPDGDASKLPLRKRWPGKYALKLVVYTPSGTRLEFETHSSNEYAKKLLADFTELVCGREPLTSRSSHAGG